MGGCDWNLLPVPVKQVSGCSVIFLTLCMTPQKAFFGLPGEIIYLRFSGKMVPMGALLCQVPPVCQRSVLPSSC